MNDKQAHYPNEYHLLALSRMRRLARVVVEPMTMDDYGPFVSELTLLAEYVIKDLLVEARVQENEIRTHDLAELLRRLVRIQPQNWHKELMERAKASATVLGDQSVQSRYSFGSYDEKTTLILLGACDNFIKILDDAVGLPVDIEAAWQNDFLLENVRRAAAEALIKATDANGVVDLPAVPKETLLDARAPHIAKRLGAAEPD